MIQSGIYHQRYFNVNPLNVIEKDFNSSETLDNNPIVYCYSGLYDTSNAFLYIGSAWDCKRRNYNHLRMLSNNNHDSVYFQNAWNKHGKDNFKYFILENTTIELSREREQNWIDYFSFNYGFDKLFNSNEVVEKPFINRKHSEKTIAKISKLAKERDMTGAKNPFFGRKHTDETKEKIRKTRVGKPLTKESIQKRTETSIKNGNFKRNAKRLSKPVKQLDLNNNFIRMWKSTIDVKRNTGIDNTSISRVCNGKQNHAGNFKWEYATKEEIEAFEANF